MVMPTPHADPLRRQAWALAIAVGVVLFGPGLYHVTRLAVMRWRLDRKLAVLSAEQEQLRQEQARLQSDPTYVEGRIRSTFKVAQPGEVVIPLNDHKRSQ